MDLYKTAVKGGLKLKGSSSSSSSGADTKKYALQKSMTGKSLANNTPLYRKKTKRKQEDITASSSATPPSVNHERESKDSGEKKTVVNQTAAERAFEEKQKKRKLEQIEKFAKQSHKDRVNEFNKKLERLSEHHDIPKNDLYDPNGKFNEDGGLADDPGLSQNDRLLTTSSRQKLKPIKSSPPAAAGEETRSDDKKLQRPIVEPVKSSPIPPPISEEHPPVKPPADPIPQSSTKQFPIPPEMPPRYKESLNHPQPAIPEPNHYGSGKGYADPEGMKQVKSMMKHAWDNYVKYAWGQDDLKPVSKQGMNWLGNQGLAATIIDSLDTLWIMGMKEEFHKARSFVADQLDFNQPLTVSVFETTIRVVGGLNSAYDLTGDKMFLTKSTEIADRLLPAFSTGTGIPYTWVTLNSGSGSMFGQGAVLAEYGSTQIEFQYLSDLTGNTKYAEASMRAMDYALKQETPIRGLYPTYIDAHGGKWHGGSYTLGAMADSFYEYILKYWLYTDKTKNFYREKYDDAAHAIEKHLIRKTEKGDLYVGSGSGDYVETQMEHLACFSAGMYALGAVTKRDEDWQHMLEIGANLTETCYKMYHTQPFGIGAEKTNIPDWNPSASYYILRPEVVESIFYMWRLTHDEKYRQWGAEIMNSLEKYCRVDGGYSGLHSVNSNKPEYTDRQESFFLAETLKYLYLLFTNDDVLPLEEYVFNTEAHPVRTAKYRKPSASSSA